MKKQITFFGLYYGYFILLSLIILMIHQGRKAEFAGALLWFNIFYLLTGLLLVLFIPRLLSVIHVNSWRKVLMLITVLVQMNLIVFVLDGRLWLSYALATDLFDGSEIRETNNLMLHLTVVAAFVLAALTVTLFKNEGNSTSYRV